MMSPYSISLDLEKQFIAAGFTLRSLDLNSSVIYVLDRRYCIVYCNPAWNSFALENDGKNLEREIVTGKPCLDVIPSSLRPFYESAFATVSQLNQPWEHDYECSSPEKYRVFHMRVLPLHGTHLLVENSLFIERSHGPNGDETPADHSKYIDQNGMVAMCAHCRKTLAVDPGGQNNWEWIPSYLISTPAPVSHCLCPTCLAYYYKTEQ